MSSTSATRVASARSAVGASSGSVLRVRDLHVDYAGALRALHGVSVDVPRGGVVAVLGANGAGKSTLLRAISGTLRFAGGRVVEGSVELDGIRLDAMDPAAVVRSGVVQVPEGRQVFEHLSVEENLRAGGLAIPLRARKAARERIYDTVPVAPGARRAAGRPALGWRTADAGDRAGADGRATSAATGRAIARSGTTDGRPRRPS